MSFPAYSDYKDSGVVWLGAVPAHWRVDRISRLFGLVGSGTTPGSDQAFEGGTVNWVTTGELREQPISSTIKQVTKETLEALSALQIYEAGTLLIAMYGATIGRLGWLEAPACTNQACCAIGNPTGMLSRFAFYCLSVATGALVLLSSGGGQPNINQEKIRAFRLPSPPLAEQEAIAGFLDRETAKIDALVAEQERLIALLKEKRQAVISHAVTKGLNPNAPMKDSGIEWLGQVPAHWSLTTVGRVCLKISYGFTNPMPTSDEGPYMLTANDIGNRAIRYETARRTEIGAFQSLLTDKSRPTHGDVLLTKDGTLGRVAVFDGRPACINQSVAYLRPAAQISSHFLAIALSDGVYQPRMIYEAGGTTIKHIYISKLAKMPFAVPPTEEMAKIEAFCEVHFDKATALQLQAAAAITLLQERRAALISAAVTGKIDVRAAVDAPQLETA